MKATNRLALRPMVAVGLALAGVGGFGGYGMYRQRLKDNKAITPHDYHKNQGEKFSAILQASKVQFMDSASTGLEFYRFATCPYCGTVKAMLDYYSIPYTVVEVDPMLKTQIKPHGYGKVPHLKFPDGTIMVDSEEINSLIASKMGAPTNPEVDKWRMWSRLQLSRYIVLVINKTLMSSVEAYNYIDDVQHVPGWSKLMLKGVGGPVMYMVAKYKTRKTLHTEFGFGLEADAEKELYAQMDSWVASFGAGQKFHGGAQPDLADLDVYGILSSARYLPLYDNIKAQTKAAAWIQEMDNICAQNSKEMKA